MVERIDHITNIPEGYGFEDIYFQYGTGVSTGTKNSPSYRNGVMTPVGDIEYSVWCEAARDLISRHHEDALFDALFAWTGDHCPWLHSKKERYGYALELHINRVFLNPK